jgi:hypothetical protein
MIDRTTIIRGPCKITYDGVTFYTREGVVLNINRNTSPVPVDGFGTVDRYLTGTSVTAEFVPHGRLDQATLDVLYACALLQPGQSIFGSTDKAMVIVSAAETVTILNAAITRPPGLAMQAGRPPLQAVQFTGLVAKNADPALLASYLTTAGGAAIGVDIGRDMMFSGFWGATWTPASIETWPAPIYSEGGWELAVTLGLSPVNVDGIGAVDMTVTDIEAQVRGIPIGVTPAMLRQAMAPVPPGGSIFFPDSTGTEIASGVLSVQSSAAEPPVSLLVAMPKAALTTASQRWKADQNRNGQIAWQATRFVSGTPAVLQPLFEVTLLQV